VKGKILIQYITLNLNISASRHDIKNMVGNFGALHVGNMHANFQASSSTSMGGGGGDGQIQDITHFPMSQNEISNSTLALPGRDNLVQ